MKQIKTVIYPISEVREFDKQINNLIASGWALTRRTLTTTQDISEAFNIASIPILYAELEHYNKFEEVTL